MGYDMYSVDGKEYFRANIWAMQLLRSAMHSAGVDLVSKKKRTAGGGQVNVDATLIDCFCTNDGWYVLPEECKEIAEKLRSAKISTAHVYKMSGDEVLLKKKKLSKDEQEYIREFAEFCEKVKDQGFYVW